MFIKIIILISMIFILVSLVSGIVFLVRDSGKSDRTVKALSIRIGISVALFLFLFIAFYMGWIKPHGV